ncbi:MAG: hypothetical protein LBS59_02580, partial [Puniceicoccales bacterium]|nr:hypothetical protein [Puniceicoccales bacterium]
MSKINNTRNTSPPWFTQSVQAGGKIVAAVVADVGGAGRAAAGFNGKVCSVTYSGAFSSFSTFAIRVCAAARLFFARTTAATTLVLTIVAGSLASAPVSAACGISRATPPTPFLMKSGKEHKFQLA